MDIKEQLIDGGRRLGVEVLPDQVKTIELLLAHLAEYNQHTNLVAKADPQTVVRDHVMDAFSLLPILEKFLPRPQRLIDIGSGAGFPGLILAVMLPWATMHLLDSVAKKTRFLSAEVEALGLSDRVAVHTARAEELAHDGKLRGKFQVATARAVGSLELVAELCLPFLEAGGYLLAQKSRRQAGDELKAAAKSIELLGGKAAEIMTPNVEATERDLVVVVVEKVKATPAKYPRKGGQLKRPLTL